MVFSNDLWCFKSGNYFRLFLIVFSNVLYICSHYLSHFIYYCCFNIVTFVILCLCLSCICRYLICLFVWDHNGNKCLHFFVSSFYLMYFVFISYVYLYNVLRLYNKSIHSSIRLSRGRGPPLRLSDPGQGQLLPAILCCFTAWTHRCLRSALRGNTWYDIFFPGFKLWLV